MPDTKQTKMPRIYDDACRDTIGASAANRSGLLARVGRWTQGSRGLYNEVVITSEVMLAHGLGQDEIDRWMDAYERKDFEALKVSATVGNARDCEAGARKRLS